MSGEKQIEDLGEYIAEVSHLECGIKCCEECKWCGSANLQKADCTDYLIAEKLIEKGYRKTSDIAREVLDELGRRLYSVSHRETSVTGYAYSVVDIDEIAYEVQELKKKYTEEGK